MKLVSNLIHHTRSLYSFFKFFLFIYLFLSRVSISYQLTHLSFDIGVFVLHISKQKIEVIMIVFQTEEANQILRLLKGLITA